LPAITGLKNPPLIQFLRFAERLSTPLLIKMKWLQDIDHFDTVVPFPADYVLRLSEQIVEYDTGIARGSWLLLIKFPRLCAISLSLIIAAERLGKQ
jgi:hypothetical protein